jgi:hypothetical protein
MGERTLWASLSGSAEFIDLNPDSILRRVAKTPSLTKSLIPASLSST